MAGPNPHNCCPYKKEKFEHGNTSMGRMHLKIKAERLEWCSRSQSMSKIANKPPEARRGVGNRLSFMAFTRTRLVDTLI